MTFAQAYLLWEAAFDWPRCGEGWATEYEIRPGKVMPADKREVEAERLLQEREAAGDGWSRY